ncbi:MAG: bifunctional oligoribonuclease/PAP phosphatase NrnA [Syntrophobacteraceae bacterium]
MQGAAMTIKNQKLVPGQKLPRRKKSKREDLESLYSQFCTKDRVLVTIDPDPDSIASAIALKRLLWHKVQSTTIGMTRPIKRLNNLTMVRLLRLPLIHINTVEQTKDYDKFVLVDGQPYHNDLFSQISYTAIIDHHPLTRVVEAPVVDIRPDYGATSTMFTQYLKIAKVKPFKALATALLYGVKTDTRNFERNTLEEDIEAFHYLYPLANHYILRKIEISDLSLKDLKLFERAIDKKHVVRNRIFTHLDHVPSADVLVIIAEFLLKVHDISWSIVSGIVEDKLVVIVRNDGYRKDAGKSLTKAFGSIGCAGGHQAMARAEVPMENLVRAMEKKPTSLAIEQFIRKRLSPFS